MSASSSPDLRVNTFVSGRQEQPDLAIGALDNFVITWQSDNQDGDGFGIYGRAYNNGNSPVSSEFQINTTTTGNQTDAAVAMDGSGNFIVTWQGEPQGGSRAGIFGQRFQSNGQPIGSEFQVNGGSFQTKANPDVSVDASGNFVVVYESEGQNNNSLGQDLSGTGIFGQRFNRTGALVGPEFRINTRTERDQTNPVVAVNVEGSFVVAWVSDDGNGTGIFGQRYSSTGQPIGIEFQINSETRGTQSNPSIAIDDTGNYVVAWQGDQGRDSSGFGIYAQRYSSTGNPLGSEILVNETTRSDQVTPSVAMDAGGNFGIVWASGRNRDSRIFGQRFLSSGSRDGSEFQVNESNSDEQASPVIGLSPTGDFAVTWQNRDRSGGDTNIRARTTVFKRVIRGTQQADDLRGTRQGDRILGLRGDDVLRGVGGSDILSGGLGSDRLEGGDDNDVLQGGANDDILDGGNGNDTLTGNNGSDTFVLRSKRGNTVITDYQVGIDLLGLSSGINANEVRIDQQGENTILSWRGSRLATLLGVAAQDITPADFVKASRAGVRRRGTSGNDRLVGTGGSDELLGLGGNDTLLGQGDSDLLDGDIGNDQLQGEAGSDELLGGDGDDRLEGGDGDDRLQAGNGNDQLRGGAGKDTFFLETKTGLTVIQDFQDGTDVFQLATGLSPRFVRFQPQGNDTLIQYGNQTLALVQNIAPSQLSVSSSDFA
jgi:Ca2+-binding RTX toxin-like protein